MWIRVLSVPPPWRSESESARVIKTGDIVFVNLSGWRSISMTSACRVTAWKGAKPSASTRWIGSCLRSHAAVWCQESTSRYRRGSVKIESVKVESARSEIVAASFICISSPVIAGSDAVADQADEQVADLIDARRAVAPIPLRRPVGGADDQHSERAAIDLRVEFA